MLFLYLRSKTGHQKSRIQFELATNNFSLELFFFNDPELCYKWMQVLGKFCVKKNLSEDFKLKKKLDKGGFAVVYLGERKRDGALFALKFMDKRKVENEKSYVREIKKCHFSKISRFWVSLSALGSTARPLDTSQRALDYQISQNLIFVDLTDFEEIHHKRDKTDARAQPPQHSQAL